MLMIEVQLSANATRIRQPSAEEVSRVKCARAHILCTLSNR